MIGERSPTVSTQRRDPPEFRAKAVRLGRSSEKSLLALAADLGISAEALGHCLQQADTDVGQGQLGDLTTNERETLRRLLRKVKAFGVARPCHNVSYPR